MITFAICTYNRGFVISNCLESFLKQKNGPLDFEVLVVDNGSTDDTADIVDAYAKKNTIFRYTTEEKTGLSHARNKAFQEAKGDWVAYIDDDAVIAENYINRLAFIISNFDFDGFGGAVEAWYLFGQPKWLPEDFESLDSLTKEPAYIDGQKGWLIGCNMIFKKKVLEVLGGFSPEFGPVGNAVGYGDDDSFQKKVIQAGYKLGFDSGLKVRHAVSPHKLKLAWHFKSAYAHGISHQKMTKKSLGIRFYTLMKSAVGLFIKRLPTAVYKFLFHKKYYWQNAVLDLFAPLFYHFGSLKS